MKISAAFYDLLLDIDLEEINYFDTHSRIPFLLTKLIFTTKMQIQPEINWNQKNPDEEMTILTTQIDKLSIKQVSRSKKVNYHQLGHPWVPLLLKGLEIARIHPEMLQYTIQKIFDEQSIPSIRDEQQNETAKV